ncbi:MAG: paraquat-inducible protein A [Motiliproteus sp.]|jgi:paraquat-inducible protein A
MKTDSLQTNSLRTGSLPTGRDAGLALCACCRKLQRLTPHKPGTRRCCLRCGSTLHPRIPKSILRTWAFTLIGLMMMIPANIYPVMTVIYLGTGEPDTILSGVIHLAQEGMLPIAILVFIASIAVPLIKLLGILLLLFSIQGHWHLNRRQCTLLYRVIQFIGRWSMLDLFIIAILVTLVDLGSIATISAGAGASAFAGVVVLTIFAALSFDPRLIWDQEAPRND